jgi:hypothetical protein
MEAESRSRLGYWGSVTLSMRSNVSLGRKRDCHRANLVIMVGDHQDGQPVWHQYRWQMGQGQRMACLGYSMGHADEVPFLLVVAI